MSDFLKILENEVQIAALSFMAVVYILRLAWIFRFRTRRDRTFAAGRASAGAGYSLMNIAMPWAMESTRKRPGFYAQFVVFHLGVAAAIAGTLIIPYAPGLFESRPVVLLFQALIAAAFAVGFVRLVRRLEQPGAPERQLAGRLFLARPPHRLVRRGRAGRAQPARKRGGAAHRLLRPDGLLPRLRAVLEDLPLPLLSLHPATTWAALSATGGPSADAIRTSRRGQGRSGREAPRRRALPGSSRRPLDPRTQARAKEDGLPRSEDGRLRTYEPGDNVAPVPRPARQPRLPSAGGLADGLRPLRPLRRILPLFSGPARTIRP